MCFKNLDRIIRKKIVRLLYDDKSLSTILLNRRKVDIFPYCKKSANIYLHKSNIHNFVIVNIGFMYSDLNLYTTFFKYITSSPI